MTDKKRQENKPEALQTAHEVALVEDGIVERNGVRARFVAVPPGLIQDAQGRVENPVVPMWIDPDKDREMPNPTDPEYLRLMGVANNRRAAVIIDVMAMFGIELIDGVPDYDTWGKRLRVLEKVGAIDLEWVNWDDEIDVEFVYKRYIFMQTADMQAIGKKTGVPQAAISQAAGAF